MPRSNVFPWPDVVAEEVLVLALLAESAVGWQGGVVVRWRTIRWGGGWGRAALIP